jgi:hypothetical protein
LLDFAFIKLCTKFLLFAFGQFCISLISVNCTYRNYLVSGLFILYLWQEKLIIFSATKFVVTAMVKTGQICIKNSPGRPYFKTTLFSNKLLCIHSIMSVKLSSCNDTWLSGATFCGTPLCRFTLLPSNISTGSRFYPPTLVQVKSCGREPSL